MNFLHALPVLPPTTGAPLPPTPISWWAVHCSTLTPIRVTTHGERLSLAVLIDPAHIVLAASHPDSKVDPPAIASALLEELRTSINPRYTLHRSGIIPPGKVALPDHLIVFDIHGDHPSVWRSLDPRMILPVRVQTIGGSPVDILDPATHWRTSIDIPVSGWTYWWEECQNALEDLTPQLASDTQ